MRRASDIIYPGTIPFILIHLACFAAIWTGVRPIDVAVGLGLYLSRMFGVTAGYHRYFSHRAFATSRAGQFLLGFLAQSSAQKGIFWWAAKHRHHHRHSDTPADVHSPLQHGFLYAHIGWIFDPRHDDDQYDAATIRDLTQFPELRWLNRHQYLPATLLGVAVFATLGWSGLVVAFCWSTVALWHGTFMINSLAHVHGRRRYLTGDDSRNNWALAVITLGEGWHNNHHYFQSAARQGFRWWQIDVSYYALSALKWLGLVWDLKQPPAAAVRGERRVSRDLVDKAQIALTSAHARWDVFHERCVNILEEAAAQRSQLADRAVEVWHEVALSGNQFAERAAERLHALAADGSHAADRAREALKRLADSGAPIADRARELLDELAAATLQPQPA